MEKEKKMKRGVLYITFYDDREDEWNCSMSFSKDIYYNEDRETLEIDKFCDACVSFLRAYGYSDEFIDENFGPYF